MQQFCVFEICGGGSYLRGVLHLFDDRTGQNGGKLSPWCLLKKLIVDDTFKQFFLETIRGAYKNPIIMAEVGSFVIILKIFKTIEICIENIRKNQLWCATYTENQAILTKIIFVLNSCIFSLLRVI